MQEEEVMDKEKLLKILYEFIADVIDNMPDTYRDALDEQLTEQEVEYLDSLVG